MSSADHTLAIIVSQESPHVAATYAALVDQTHPPVAVLVATKAPQMLPQALGEAEVVTYEGTFSEGVQAALRDYEAGGGKLPTWLWLLHDDSIPELDALEQLARAVAQARAVGVAGSKQVSATRSDELLSVGTSYTRFGARYTGVEPGDLDQGQLDGRDDIYAVGTAGMLIRTDVWQELGGAEPATTPWLDGLDISRKAHLNGHRVIVVPSAAVRHHRQTFNRGNTYPARRRAVTFHTWATVSLGLLPVVMLASIVGGALRALWRIATKQFTESWADLTAPWRVLAHPIVLAKARRRYARIKTMPRSRLNELLTPVAVVRAMRRDHRRTISESRKVVAAPSELELQEKAALTRKRRITLSVVLAIPFLMSLIALAPTLLGGPIIAATLPGTDSTWQQLWQQVASGWIASGDGVVGPSHPIVVALFGLNTVMGGFWGTPLWVSVALILGLSPLLTTWGAWVAAGSASRSLLLRAVIALAWGVGPALWLFVAGGALAEVVVYTALPWWIYALVRTLGCDLRDVISSGLEADREPVHAVRSGSASMAAAASGGLLLALIAMNIPGIGIAAGITALVALRASRHMRSAGARRRIWLMQIPMWVAVAPFIATLIGVSSAQGWWQLILSPTHPSWNIAGSQALPLPLWIPFAALAAIAAGTIVRSGFGGGINGGLRGRAVVVGWSIATLGTAIFLAPTLLASLIPEFFVPGHGGAGHARAGGSGSADVIAVGLIFVWAGWGVAAAAGWAGVAQRLQKRSFGIRHMALGVMTLGSVVVIVGSAVLWPMVFQTARSEDPAPVAAPVVDPLAEHYVSIQQRTSDPLSAMGRQIQSEELQGRVLALQATPDGIVAQVWRGPGVQFAHIPARPVADTNTDEATTQLRQAIANLAAGGSERIDEPLARHGIQLVVIPPADSQLMPGDEHLVAELVANVERTDGVDFVTNHSSGAVYRVNPRTPNARALLIETGGTDSSVLPWDTSGIQEKVQTHIAVPAGGQLVLAERRSSGWKATIDGQPLRSLSEDWRQTFEIPVGAQGNLEVHYDAPLHTIWLVASGLTLLIFGLLSVPITRRSGNEET